MITRVKKDGYPSWSSLFFDGDDVRIWLDNCESYFDMYQILEGPKINATSMHLKGKAIQIGVFDWRQFRAAVLNEFDGTSHADKMLELLTLTQTSSVVEYKAQFEKLAYYIKLFDKAISEMFLVTQFVLGLKPEIRNGVELQFPQTVCNTLNLGYKFSF
jgi:hypothetical protein